MHTSGIETTFLQEDRKVRKIQFYNLLKGKKNWMKEQGTEGSRQMAVKKNTFAHSHWRRY